MSIVFQDETYLHTEHSSLKNLTDDSAKWLFANILAYTGSKNGDFSPNFLYLGLVSKYTKV